MEHKKSLTFEETCKMQPEQLAGYLQKVCFVKIPPSIETVDDMKNASRLLSRCGSLYAYNMSAGMLPLVKVCG